MLRRTVLLAAVASAALLTPGTTLAQAEKPTRGERVGDAPEAPAAVELGRYIFAGVGIDEYDHTGVWKTLGNAVNDVQRVRETLRDGFGFEAPDQFTLLDSAATKDGIFSMIDKLDGELSEIDNVVFFYAGHGDTHVRERSGKVYRTGYLVPSSVDEALEDGLADYIRIENLLDRLSLLNARHVLVILDACYSGMALDGTIKEEVATRGGPRDDAPHTLMANDSRRVLTSAGSDEVAADSTAFFPNNSLFTGLLTSGLQRALEGAGPDVSANLDSNNYITASELFQFLQGRVADLSDQTPAFGRFGEDLNGEMIFWLDRDPFGLHYAAALDAWDADDEATFASAAEDAFAARPDQADEDAQVVYLRYLLAWLNGNDVDRLTHLLRLQELKNAGVEIPSEIGSLRRTIADVRKVCGAECLPAGGAD